MAQDTVRETVTVPVQNPSTPITPEDQRTAPPTQQVTVQADAKREYVAGNQRWWPSGVHAQPWVIDDVTEAFGDDLYERMLVDPMIYACFDILRASILEDGLRLTSAIADRDKPQYDKAGEITDFCSRVLADITNLDDVLRDMCRALALGNKVAEQVYDYTTTYTGKTQLRLVSLKVKPRRAVAFVVDPYLNVIGLLGLLPGQSSSLLGWGSPIVDVKNQANLLPREKFAVLTWAPEDSDPRGTSLLRTAFSPWQHKQDTYGEYWRFLQQFASPIPIGFADPDSPPRYQKDAGGNYVLDSNGMPLVLTPQEDMIQAFELARNGAALAFGSKARVETLFSGGDGKAFLAALDKDDAQIAIGILGQTLAQGSSQQAHSRAASQVHERITDTKVKQAKLSVTAMLRWDVCQQLVRYNYGDALVALTPKVTLGDTEPQTFAADITALASAGYQVHKSQFAGIASDYGLPEPDPDWLAAPDPAMPSDNTVAGAAATPPASPGAGGEGNDAQAAPPADGQPPQPPPQQPAPTKKEAA